MQLDRTQFNAGLRMILEGTKRTISEEINQRGLNVAGRSANEMDAASKVEIHQELGEIARGLRVTKKGRLVRSNKRIYATGRNGAPRAALIINARRARAGKKGLHGKEMQVAINRMVSARKGSTGFKKSGWFWAIRNISSRIRRPFIIARMRGIRWSGASKGRGTAAVESWTPTAVIENTTKGLSEKDYATLQKAMNVEGEEMRTKAISRLQKVADKHNGR